MIPTIERIIEMMLNGEIAKATAINMLHQHAHDAYHELRDNFAAAALISMGNVLPHGYLETADDAATRAEEAYRRADAMLAARSA